jgi:hypothetical protein
MCNIEAALQRALEAYPQRDFRVIVRTGQAAAALVPECKAMGLEVHHVYKLVPGMAVSGSGAGILRLAEQPWVETIEPDQAVGVF